MLAANGDTDGTEAATADAASPAPLEDSDRAGVCRHSGHLENNKMPIYYSANSISVSIVDKTAKNSGII